MTQIEIEVLSLQRELLMMQIDNEAERFALEKRKVEALEKIAESLAKGDTAE